MCAHQPTRCRANAEIAHGPAVGGISLPGSLGGSMKQEVLAAELARRPFMAGRQVHFMVDEGHVFGRAAQFDHLQPIG
jgi:hypothetical protein